MISPIIQMSIEKRSGRSPTVCVSPHDVLRIALAAVDRPVRFPRCARLHDLESMLYTRCEVVILARSDPDDAISIQASQDRCTAIDAIVLGVVMMERRIPASEQMAHPDFEVVGCENAGCKAPGLA